MRMRSWNLRFAIVSFAVVAVACGDDNKKITLDSGEAVEVTADAQVVESGNAVTVTADPAPGVGPLLYQWMAAAGRFADSSAATTTWTAPDGAGDFTLSCIVTDDVGVGIGSTDVSVTQYMPTDSPAYRGAEVCSGCHAQEGQPGGDQYNPWLASDHAEAIESLRNIGQGENTYCLRCHTVGTYGKLADASLDNGGYDDTSVDRLAGVQCENCHGPASQHPNPDFGSVEVDLASEVCGDCHTDEHHPTYDEWLESGHSMPIGFAAGRASCAKCHNGVEGPRYLDDPEGYTDPTEDPTEIVAHTCAVCHDPHGNDNPGNLRDASVDDVVLPNAIHQPNGGAGKLCMSCHNGRRQTYDVIDQIINGSSHFGPHHSVQGDMISGVNAFEEVAPEFPFTSSLHILVEDACVTCHTSPNAGDPSAGIANFTGHTFEPTVEACLPCHGELDDFSDVPAKADFDGNGLIEGVQVEIQGLLDLLEQVIIDASETQEARDALEDDFEHALGDVDVTTVDQRAAGYNWAFVEFDASTGVHNTTYSVQLLQQSALFLDPLALGPPMVAAPAYLLVDLD